LNNPQYDNEPSAFFERFRRWFTVAGGLLVCVLLAVIVHTLKQPFGSKSPDGSVTRVQDIAFKDPDQETHLFPPDTQAKDFPIPVAGSNETNQP